MRRTITVLTIIGALALTACSGGTGTRGSLSPEERARLTALVRSLGTPASVRLLSIAIGNIRRQNYGNAIQAATAAVESGGLTPRGQSLAYSIRATAYGMTNRRKLASADIDEALRVDPRNVMAINAKAGEALLAGKLNEAERRYSQSIAIRPTGRAHFARAYIRYMRRQYPAALVDANQSIAIFPRPAAPYAIRGMIEHAMGRKDAARRDFNQALSRNPKSELARQGLRALNAGRPPFRPPQFLRQTPGKREGAI